MRKISSKTKQILLSGNKMNRCCLEGTDCQGKIEWHHNLIYAGKQSDISETILPLCHFHHRYADQTDIKEELDWIMLNQMSDEQITSISKGQDYFQRKKYVTEKFGEGVGHSKSNIAVS